MKNIAYVLEGNYWGLSPRNCPLLTSLTSFGSFFSSSSSSSSSFPFRYLFDDALGQRLHILESIIASLHLQLRRITNKTQRHKDTKTQRHTDRKRERETIRKSVRRSLCLSVMLLLFGLLGAKYAVFTALFQYICSSCY